MGGAIAVTAAISVLGAVIGPAWRPRELVSDVVPASPDTSVHSKDSVRVGTYEFTTETVDVDFDGFALPAIVRAPVGVDEDLRAVVFMHGAGTHAGDAFKEQAEALASAGIVTIVPAKRMDNYSTAHRDYVQMARDYGRSVTLAAGLPGVTKVGIYAESEGAYSAPVLANENPDVDFVVLVSPPVVPAREQSTFATDNYLRNVGVPNALFRTIPRALGVTIPFGWMQYADFDPAPYQQQMTQPTFLAFGTGDASMPLVQGTEQLRDDLAVAGNHHLTARFYADANHGIKVGPHRHEVLSEDFAQGLADWIRGYDQMELATSDIAGATPEQTYRADPLPPVRWFLSGNALIGTHAGAVGLLAVGAGAAGVRWLVLKKRRRNGMAVAGMPRDVAGYLAGAGVVTIAAWAGFAVYLTRVADLAFNYETDPAWTYGVYAGQQVVALGAATLLGAALVQGHIKRSEITGANRAIFVTTAAGTGALLVLAAYWGGFPDITGGAGI
ncbi:hypothetical protein SAMN06298212_11069 [Ruaniaceae bacterium KH17]|nr:hypothetical protein SAMN06298212_11069 [Ruaniaceae bacterium KH17]